MTETRIKIFMFAWEAATNPALNRIESPGRKKPSKIPVSTKIITPIRR